MSRDMTVSDHMKDHTAATAEKRANLQSSRAAVHGDALADRADSGVFRQLTRSPAQTSAAMRLPVALECVAYLGGGDPAAGDVNQRQLPLLLVGQHDEDVASCPLVDSEALDL